MPLAMGSPPRVRGLLIVATAFQLQGGITPACAGTTQECRHCAPARRDHPRVCGDYSNQAFSAVV